MDSPRKRLVSYSVAVAEAYGVGAALEWVTWIRASIVLVDFIQGNYSACNNNTVDLSNRHLHTTHIQLSLFQAISGIPSGGGVSVHKEGI
jgi:hypothetical protein